tara:strand:+ start:245 stop:514 length:270 start_codon:yes stop_codon:yes gene_type:complete
MSNRRLAINIPLSISALGMALSMALLCGGLLVFMSHVLTVRSMHGEMERWRELGHSLTTTTEDCMALLPKTWTGTTKVRLQDSGFQAGG